MIKPKYEIVEFDTGDILLSSGAYYPPDTYITCEVLKELEDQFNNGQTSKNAFVDITNFSSSDNIAGSNDGYYRIDSIVYVGKMSPGDKNNPNKPPIPHYEITLANNSYRETVNGKHEYDDINQVINWLNSYSFPDQ